MAKRDRNGQKKERREVREEQEKRETREVFQDREKRDIEIETDQRQIDRDLEQGIRKLNETGYTASVRLGPSRQVQTSNIDFIIVHRVLVKHLK